jgi:hypothetical protein
VPVGLSFAGTYPLDEDFWVPAEEADAHPPRYGDLFATPELTDCRDSKGRLWRAVLAVHPSCEMGAKGAPAGVQVVRVHLLREVSQGQRDEVRAGFREREGRIEICRANMLYLAPVPAGAALAEELFADLRVTARVPLDALLGGRRAAMTHDARVALLRRDAYFRFRWPLTLEAVAALERDRISGDAAFAGPRPSWSTVAPPPR